MRTVAAALSGASNYNSQNLNGSLARALAALRKLLLAAALGAVWLAFARDRLSFERALAAALVAFVAFGKILPARSPLQNSEAPPRRGFAVAGL